jgi:Leucine-rich repeat (LRR) protein
MCPELRQDFWRLCAENDKSPVLRCADRNLLSIDFMKGLNFSLIDCSDNKIASLTPLKGMSLSKLDCAGNEITSLEPLRKMKLISLECHENKKLTDISALSGMPLKTLSLSGCDLITSLKPISKCVTLERLTVPARFADSPIIKALPNLKFFNTKWDAWKTTKKEFFKKSKKNKLTPPGKK